MKRYRMYGMVMAIALFVFAGCGSDLSRPKNEKVDGGEVVVSFTGDEVKRALLDKGVPGVTEETTVYGYKAYKIPYITTDEEGNKVRVSGLMVVPTGMPKAVQALGYSLVSDSHGTIFADYEAPTVHASITNAPEGAPIILTSLFGFVTLQADYIGYGDSAGHYHPFVMKNSLANATVDFIEAAREFALKNNIPLNGQLFVTGYSEGGYTALAALEKIETYTDIDVAVAAPMAGPYDLNRTAFYVLDPSDENLSYPSFMAFVGYAYTKAYEIPLDSVINEPYASKLPELFSGAYTREEIDAQLPHVKTGENGLFNSTFVYTFFNDPSMWFRQAVLVNSVNFWGPKTPVKLLHCEGDDVIPYPIAQWTEGTLKAYGAQDVTLIPVEKTAALYGMGDGSLMGHAQCAAYAYVVAASIFAQVRQATVGY
jgi:pimeloyl-ACP methyl ester carboxylesterase